jgi:hypothetical protein
MFKMTRLGRTCLVVLVVSGIAGGLFGNRAVAGGGRLTDHLRL